MNAFSTFMPRRIDHVLSVGAVLLLAACGGNVDDMAGQQSLAAVEASQPLSQPHAAPAATVAQVDVAPVDGATSAGPTSAQELFKASSDMAYGAQAQPDGADSAANAPHAEP
ncbi:hypothetical protein AB2N08_13895 [Massilia aurea]|uniref:hypothetical protein n=1 Tax=Massilia aurea TaxID=373040 RepID=UPI0034618F97